MPTSPPPIRMLLFSTLYPSAARPGHGVFVETRLRKLVDTGAVEARVVAPVPWFPSTHPRFGAWARIAATPRAEHRHGIGVDHPRYPLPPRIGQHVAPLALAIGALPAIARLARAGFRPDLVDAHYYYPDGVAAALLGRWLGLPVTITARGSDLNLIGRHLLSRRLMLWAAGRAAASIGVSQSLVDTLAGWGVDPARLQVIRNGVDLDCFRPRDRAVARRRLAIGDGPVVLCVGNLVDVKGQSLAVDAIAALAGRQPTAALYLVGDGPLRGALAAQAAALGIGGRVHLVGAVGQADLANWYSASDLLLLPSKSEGWANVLLEAMACGTPVVATNVGGNAEVIGRSGVGTLVAGRDPAELAEAIARRLADPPPRERVRAYAEGFSWDATTQAQLRLFRAIVAGRRGVPRAAAVSR